MKTAALCALAILSSLVLIPAAWAAQPPEWRAMWVNRFEWTNGDNQTIIKNRIDTMMQNLADAHFNAVVFQVRGQADTLYPSPYEPWSTLLSDHSWDPVAYAIDAAHSRGIQFHAWINENPCWQSGVHARPNDLNHLFYAHCDARYPDKSDWLICDSAGNPVQWSENDYVWMAPGVPGYQAYIRKQIMYVVETYDVDGIHYDRIRTPNSLYSYDPISNARRASTQSNPNSLSFHAWTADQTTRMVRDIYAAVNAAKPDVEIAASVFPDPLTSPVNQHQDGCAWAQTGGVDMLVPMMYSAGGAGSTWDTRLQNWLACRGDRHVIAGHGANQGLASLLQQIALTRLRGGHGNCVYAWSNFTYYNDYLANVYQEVVSPPALTWKTAPTTGIICGTIKDQSGTPVVDAQIVRTGSSYVGLSSGDGFYSFLRVPAGNYTLTASHPTYGNQAVPVTVSNGAVTQQDIILPPPPPPVVQEVSPDPDAIVAGATYARQLVLTQGVADMWTVIAGPTGAAVSASGLVSWPGTATYGGQTVTITVRAANSSGYDDESWQVNVSEPPPCTIVKLTGFEGYADGTASVMFRNPRYSGSTDQDLTVSPDVALVSAATSFKGSRSLRVQWQFVDTAATRWLRLTTHDTTFLRNPIVALDRPIRVRMRVDAGTFRLCIGIRETASTADYGADGGAVGTIEWVGASSAASPGVAPQGVLVTAQPGVWQTFTFKPLTDPITPMTGDGILSSSTNKGVFEQIAFSMVDTVGPFTVYIDEVDHLCSREPFGDLNGDGYVDGIDFDLFVACTRGPDIALNPSCAAANNDDDGDVDADDFGAFQRCFDPLAAQLNPNCGD